MKFKVFSELSYQVYQPSTFLFNIEAAQTNGQSIIEEHLSINIDSELEKLVTPSGTRLVRTTIHHPVTFTIYYNAIVETNYTIINEHKSSVLTALTNIQPEVIPYLFPSRYCQSDKLQHFAYKLFGNITDDYAKTVAICDWIFNNIDYKSGSTNSYTSALDTLTERAGVCRDFAHLGIALCRASSIPARYFTGYAFKLNPSDFHACFEAYINGNWIFFDATRLIPINGLVKIGNGLDASDTAVTNIFGSTYFNYIVVGCEAVDENSFQPFYAWENKESGLCYG